MRRGQRAARGGNRIGLIWNFMLLFNGLSRIFGWSGQMTLTRHNFHGDYHGSRAVGNRRVLGTVLAGRLGRWIDRLTLIGARDGSARMSRATSKTLLFA